MLKATINNGALTPFAQDHPEQPFGLLLQRQDASADHLEGRVECHGPARAVISGYLFSVSRPDKYLWITLDSSV